MGSSAASATCLRAILREDALEVVGVVTQPDRPVGRGKVIAPCPCKAFAVEHGIVEIITPDNVNAPEAMERLRAWKPDVVAVVAFGQILRAPLLELPPHGCINCHFSLLPKFRGASPVSAAIAAGERVTGVSVMRMGPGLDDGPVIAQRYEPIYSDVTGGRLMDELAYAGGVALASTLVKISREPPGAMPGIPQDAAYATYAGKLKKSDGRILWDAPVLETERRIRAYSPWPGSYAFLPERLRKKGSEGRVGVIAARIVSPLSAEDAAQCPGTVLSTDREGPVVKCGDTALKLLCVKPEGGLPMDGGAFLRGRPLVRGDVMG